MGLVEQTSGDMFFTDLVTFDGHLSRRSSLSFRSMESTNHCSQKVTNSHCTVRKFLNEQNYQQIRIIEFM